MGELNNIFKKLNIMEQAQLNKYIELKVNSFIAECNKRIDKSKEDAEKDNKEIRKYYEDENAKTWKRIQTMLNVSMRQNHISVERMQKIFEPLKELDKKKSLLIGEEQKSEYKIMHSDDFSKMIELLMDSNCKNCHSRHSKCEVYGLLKKYNIPHAPDRGKCKYAYFRIGKKVV